MRFKFNPNTISIDSLLLLGINKFSANNLIKYREKGGRIKSIEHFYTIYGMNKYLGKYDDLLVINEIPKNTSIKEEKITTPAVAENTHYERKEQSSLLLRVIDLNNTDTLELQSLNGIGNVLARRIIKYRDALGGFYDIEQIQEVYGLSYETFSKIIHQIKIIPNDIKKINVNIATVELLAKHPYISNKNASVVIKYRNNHGPYKNFEDFKKVKVFSDEELEKLKPYLDY
jgi:competence ComEA-like helix-hairpin-helix protein